MRRLSRQRLSTAEVETTPLMYLSKGKNKTLITLNKTAREVLNLKENDRLDVSEGDVEGEYFIGKVGAKEGSKMKNSGNFTSSSIYRTLEDKGKQWEVTNQTLVSEGITWYRLKFYSNDFHSRSKVVDNENQAEEMTITPEQVVETSEDRF